MKRLLVLSLATLMVAAVGCSSAGAVGVGLDVGVLPPGPGGFDFFFDALSPYGTWMDLAPWGEVWVPDEVPAGWRPYTEGRWIDSDDGWLWMSDFDWGWAPFHYGRWDYDSEWGWMWVPGDVWGPAWVAWRYGDGFVGWAPLPPAARWIPGVGLDTDFDFGRIPRHSWVFVDRADLARPLLRHAIMPAERDDIYFHHTRNITRYDVEGGRPFDRGVDVGRIEEALHRRVELYSLVPGAEPQRGIEGHQVYVYRPQLARGNQQRLREAQNMGRERAPYLRRHIEEQRRLAERQTRQRQEMERRQQEEIGRSRGGRRALEARQRAERSAMEERQAQEREQLRETYRQELEQHHLMTRREQEARQQADQHRREAERGREERSQARERRAEAPQRRGHGGGGGR